MEENIAYIVVLAFGAFISLLYKLSYHGRRSGMDQHYGYGPMPSQYYYQRPRRRAGIGIGGALSIVMVFTLLFLFGSQFDEERRPKENYNDLGWTDRMNKKQEYNYNYEGENYKDESQYAQNENNGNGSKYEADASIVPVPDLGSKEEDNPPFKVQVEEEEVIPQKNIRIQIIAGDNEYDATDTAQKMKEQTGLNAYVMLEIGGGAQSYKVMIGEFTDKSSANQMINKLNLEGHPFPKDISEKEYREIAKF